MVIKQWPLKKMETHLPCLKGYNVKRRHFVAVVTVGNKGIGLEICRQLASNDITVIPTARDETRGLEAMEKLKVSRNVVVVVFHQLDVKDPIIYNGFGNVIGTYVCPYRREQQMELSFSQVHI